MNVRWRAHWIWNDGEASPRNEWWCFRKTFYAAEGSHKGVRLSITADSRYVLYVNGEWVGRGPARSWTSEQSYDTYDIGYLIKSGQENTIAVLVMHFGVSTFYYLRGRGGLITQLEWYEGNKVLQTIATDSTWKTSRYLGQDSRSPRMSCQQAFAERIDARLWDSSWWDPSYDDSAWPAARIIGEAGTEPWTELKARDIPLLSEEAVYPARVEALHKVNPISWTTSIDVRNQMDADSINHCNPIGYIGYIATIIRVKTTTIATLGFPNATSHLPSISINGIRIDKASFTGTAPEKYIDIELQPGDNFLLLDVTNESDHGRNLQLGIDSGASFELISPIDEAGIDDSPFISIGPFDLNEIIDHQPVRPLSLNNETYLHLQDLSAAADLKKCLQWVKPISNALISRDNVFVACIWKNNKMSLPIPYSVQHAVTSNPEPAVIPRYEGADTELIIDFGTELSGYIAFELEAAEGTVIDFYGFEYMRDGYRQDTYDLDNTLRYICFEGRQSYVSPIRRGLRYLMVTVRHAQFPLKLYKVQMRQSHYPVADIGRFQCSDSMLNDIWQISRHTTKLCMEDTFVDCPAYEQVFWVGDSRNEALINYYTFGAIDIVERCLRLVPGSKRQTPLYADQVPSGWSSVIPNWTFFWAQACKEFVDHTGDLAFADEMWPHIRYTLDHYLEKRDERGLLFIKGWNLLDWAPIEQPDNGVVTHQNLFLFQTLLSSAGLARLVGDEEGAITYESAASKLRESINRYLWSDDHQAYFDCIYEDGRYSESFSIQTQVVAYLCRSADVEREAAIKRHINKPPETFVQIGSPFMAFFYYEALVHMGEFGHMLDDMRRNYGQMVDMGATTCWEMYPNFAVNRANPNMPTRSHCHAWSAAPGYFLGAYILGVRPGALGWEEIIIEPQVAGLSWARGSVPHPSQGRIDVSWRIMGDNTIHLQVWLPRNVQATIKLPTGYEGVIERFDI
ncbi:hypothetical protein FHS14_000886 [Paenibacillus baekrokdamisoli]|nr:hypothetical protein [Paenibacillus baekrokdamisoli]